MGTDTTDAIGARAVSSVGRLGERVSLWRIATQLAPFVLAFTVYLGVFLVMRPEATGDEPHYLITAESIAYDGDVDLTNDYASRERTLRVSNAFPLPHNFQAADYTGSGQLRPVHPVGFSAFLVPFVALGGLTGARLAMVLVTALLADQLYRLLRDLRLRRRYRILGWIAAVFCLPVLVFSSQIYPELPGALLIVGSLRIMIVGSSSPAALALGSSAAAALVWLHVRYLSLSLAIVLGLTVAGCSHRRKPAGADDPSTSDSWERIRATGAIVVAYAATAVKHWRTVAVPVLVPYGIGLGLLAVAFQRWYGSLNPNAPYQAFSNAHIGSGGFGFLYDYALRDLLNPTTGWIPFAPVHWLGFAALGCLVVWFGWRAAACVAVVAGYEVLVASVGPNIGWQFPGRYPMIVIPLIAIPIALVIQEVRVARVVFVPLFGGSLLFAVVAIADFHGLYPLGDKPRIFGLRTTAVAFPNTQPPHLPTSFTLAPGLFPPRTGRVQGKTVVAKAGRDRPNYLLWGPYAPLREGTYLATFPLAATGVGGKVPVATIDVVGSPPPKLFARRVVTAGELQARPRKRVTLQFKTPGEYFTETRVFYQGLGTLKAGGVDVKAVRVAHSTRLPAWALVSLWITGTVLVGWLFVRVMKLPPKPESAHNYRADA
jgi:hypothetical protein